MNQNHLRCLAAAIAFVLFISCKTKQAVADNTFSDGYAKASKIKLTHPANSDHRSGSPSSGPQFTGREVRFEYSVPCFQRYEAMMKAHAYVVSPKGEVTITVKEEPLTTAVSYDGERLIEWMQRMLKAFPGNEPKDIGFLMMPGHLDETFLKEVGEDPAEWKYKLNRTSIFIVPVIKSEGLKFKQLVKHFRSEMVSPFFQGPTVWELGGVQP